MALTFGPGINIGSGINLTSEIVSTTGSANFVSASSQYLNATSVSVGTTLSTYEWWFYLTSLPTSYAGMFNNRGGGTATNGFNVYIDSSGFIYFNSSGGITSVLYNGGGAGISLNTWHHIAINRTSTLNRWSCYIDGVSTSLAQTNTTTNNTIILGYDPNASGSAYFNGYISNFRYVKGVQVYTGNFTVPTSPLTATQSAGTNISAITGTQTQLLLNTVNGAGFLTDSSTFNITVTNNNGVTSSALNPFGL